MPDDKNSSRKKRKKITVTEKFLLGTLRSTGYDTPYPAIYELIDNAIDAGATQIFIIYDPTLEVLTVKDNGSGISFERLEEIMNLGYDRPYNSKETGYFGSGLKSSCLNLIDDEYTDANIRIFTSDGKISSTVLWEPPKDPFLYDIEESLTPREEQGTSVIIHGVKKFSPQILKKNCGVIYYPTLRHEIVNLYVGDDMVIPNDPLYRSEISENRMNSVTGSVKGTEISISAVSIPRTQPKHSWDRDTKKESDWECSKGGIYGIYGVRYIEFGGNYGKTYINPWDSRTRIELRIPKELTKEFRVRFNKTRGADFTDTNLEIEDVSRKIKDMINWGHKLRLADKDSGVTDSEKDELTKLQNALNDAATGANFPKPDTGDEPPSLETNQAPFKGRGADIKKRRRKGESEIIRNKLFILRIENLGPSNVFWSLGFENNKFLIILNEEHQFYKTMYKQWPEEVRQDIVFVLASLGTAQYNTLVNNGGAVNIDQFWESFWGDVSLKLKHLINNK